MPVQDSTPLTEDSEKVIDEMLRSSFKRARQLRTSEQQLEKKEIPLILVSHAPPCGTSVDRLADGSHVGSGAVRDRIGATAIYNPGMLRDGGWLELELNNQNLKATLHDSR